MNILANVTSSLIGDYNKVVASLVSSMNGDTYFRIVNMSDIESINFADYDLFVNLFDDNDDIMDNYGKICAFAEQNKALVNVVSYYTDREMYDCEQVFYTKKRVMRERRHRIVTFESMYDIIFDVLLHASLYFGANINIRDGILCFKNYNVVDMGEVSYLKKNPLLLSNYKNICIAKEDEKVHVNDNIIDDRHNLREIEDIHDYMRDTYKIYNTYLENYIECYKEIITAWNNNTISTLDYLYVQEYFRIGHLTSIASCFNRRIYNEKFGNDSISFASGVNILKLIMYSMAFADSNEFVDEILSNVMRVGKRLELKYAKDSYFHYHEHDFALKLNHNDDDYSLLKDYVDMVETEVLEPNARNIYSAYVILSEYSRDTGKIDDSIEYALKAFNRVVKQVDMIKICRLLYELYSMNAEYDSVFEYVCIIMDNIALIDNGYHDDYLDIAQDIISLEDTNNDIRTWSYDVIKKVHECKYVNKIMRYTLYVTELDASELITINEDTIDRLNDLISEMTRDFYISPVDMYVNIYNAYVLLAKAYERIGDMEKATDAYKKAYIYVSTIEEIDDIDTNVSYIQYRLGDINIDNESTKSYRLLVKSEKSTIEYIMRTHKYVDYYLDLVMKIIERLLGDNKNHLVSIVSKQYLSKLVSCSAVNKLYLRDIQKFCKIMSNKFEVIGNSKQQDLYVHLAENYESLCAKNNIELN